MIWFKHDANANADSKLQNVLLDYGLEGYGLYWYCIELITRKVDVNNITFQLEHDARIIARNTGSTPQKVEEMMRYFVKIGLFENSNGIITCMKIAKRLDQSMTSNKAMREIIERIKSGNHDGVMTESCQSHAVIMQEEIRRDKKRIDTQSESGDSSVDVGQQKTQRIDYQAIADAYNSALGDRLPKCSKITEPRKKAIKKLLSELAEPTPEAAGKYFSAFASKARGFHFGENDRGWKADFDYVVRVETLIKTREGAL